MQYAPTVLQEWNLKNEYAPTLPENLKSKNKDESDTRVGAYCIRSTNILSRIIIRYTNTHLCRLRRRLWGVCKTPLPCYRNGIHKIRMYSGRGVLHTPHKRFRRKRRDSPMHKNDHSLPPTAFVGRIPLHPYHVTGMESKKTGTKNPDT